MKTWDTRFTGAETVAEGTMAFRFAKPEGFAFRPGQAIDLVLDGDQRHTFSIASAPAQDELMIATRMRNSDFKNALKALEQGAAVKLEGPIGSLTLHRAANRPAVFIAGGIGITPFLSILRHASDEGSQRRFLLLYANRRPEDAPFLEELAGLSGRLPNFRLLATMTQPATSQRKWDGERGQVDARRLEQALAGLEDPVYYLAGPPKMVEAMRELLEDAGASEEDIRSEEFFGY